MAQQFRTSSRRRSPTRALLLVTVLAIALLAINAISRGALAEKVRSGAVVALMTVEGSYDAVVHNGFFSTRASLARQDQSLQQEVTTLQDELAGTAGIRAQNQQLEALIGVAQSQPGATAAVISSFRSSPYGTFLISTGKIDATPNDLVVDGGGFVVGKVSEISAGTALVTEIFAPNASVDGSVDGISAEVDGQGGGNARMAIPQTQSSTVKVGDAVTSPTLGNRPIGVVGGISSNPSNAYATLYLSLPVNIGSLGYVYVLKQ